MTFALWCAAAMAWPVLGPEAAPTGREIDATTVFAPKAWPDKPVEVDTAAIAAVADSTRAWIRNAPMDPASRSGLFTELGVSVADTLAVLDLLVSAGNAAAATGAELLESRTFLRDNLALLGWKPDAADAASHGVKVDTQIRLTRYLVYEAMGSEDRTEVYTTPLYAAPPDDGSAEPARLRYTRQQVLGGVYEAGGEAEGLAAPLVWLTQKTMLDALMQGSVQVQLADGSVRLFNVHVNNGIPYNRDIRDPLKQGRYWYFREVPGLRGYTASELPPVDIEPKVTVAGDVYNLGLGRIVLLDVGDRLWLTVLADTGGAFQPNLYQLDWMAGVYPSHGAFLAATARIPERVGAAAVVPRAAVAR